MALTQKSDPLITLTDEARKHLDAIKVEIDTAESNLAALKELGLDVSRLEDKIAWAKKAREVILKTMK